MKSKTSRQIVDKEFVASLEKTMIRTKKIKSPNRVNLSDSARLGETTARTKIIDDEEEHINVENFEFSNISKIAQTETEWLQELQSLFNRRPVGVTSEKIKEVILIDVPETKTVLQKKQKRKHQEFKEGREHFSKNAVAKYHVEDEEKFRKDLEKKFPNSKLSIVENIAEVNIEFDKRKRWTEKSAIIQMNGGKVIEAETKIPRASIFWVVKPINLICGLSSNGSIKEDWISQFLSIGEINVSGPSEIINCFCMSLFAKIQDVTRFYSINEDVISAILASEFFKADVKYLGINHKLKEKIEEEELAFKPDLFFLWGNILYVFELKCRHDREGEADNALKCLIYKQYPARLFKYITSHRPEIAKEVIWIVGCGIAYSNASIQSQLYSTKTEQINTSYRCMDFVCALKQGKRRFKSSGDW